MNRLPAIALVIFALIVAALVRREPGSAQESSPRQPEPSSRTELQGTLSCAASLCHGGSDIGKRLSEATTWRALDPHAGAYDALLTKESRAIAGHIWGKNVQAHEAPLCLKCHVHPGYARAGPTFRKEDGVGCESCHGPARAWLGTHYWQKADKQVLGMADTKSLHGRAGICAECHVGRPGNDVDHDLIAAGHPALRFEFATYLANLPPHWDVAKDKKTNSTSQAQCVDFETRAWVVGQLAAAAQALELFAHRALSEKGKHWSELADLDCFTCHHGLKASSRRQDKERFSDRRPGALLWSNWYYTLVPDLLAGTPKETAKPSEAMLQFLARRATPDLLDAKKRNVLAGEAAALAKTLRDIAKAPVPFAEQDFCNILPLYNRLNRHAHGASWDEASQRYLALLAIRQMHRDNDQPESADLEQLITHLRKEVTFRPGFDSPP